MGFIQHCDLVYDNSNLPKYFQQSPSDRFKTSIPPSKYKYRQVKNKYDEMTIFILTGHIK